LEGHSSGPSLEELDDQGRQHAPISENIMYGAHLWRRTSAQPDAQRNGRIEVPSRDMPPAKIITMSAERWPAGKRTGTVADDRAPNGQNQKKRFR